MELTEQQLEERNNSEDNIAHIFHKNSGKDFGGRKPGSLEKPAYLKALISLVSQQDTVANTAKAFGTHSSSVSAYKDGRSSLNPLTGTVQPALVEIKNNSTEAVRTKALSIVNDALDQITIEKLEGSKLRDIAAIAKDMSIVHEKMSEEKRDDGNRVQVIIMTPKTRREEDMEVITIQAEN